MSEEHVLDWLTRPAAGKGVHLADESDGWQFRSYGELATLARGLATLLRDSGFRPGSNASIIHPTGFPAIAAIYAVWAAGGTVTLIVPPGFGDGPDYVERTAAILAAADPQLVLTSPGLTSVVSGALTAAGLEQQPFVVDEDAAAAAAPIDPIAPAELALLQFTSGSSGTPKGVRVSWDNLSENLDLITTTVGWRDGDAGASWLPLYHDMGLVGALLTTLTYQGDFYLMRPDQFVRNPARWLRAMTKAQHTASPSFGLGYAAKRVEAAEIAALDLSGWRSLVVGAEPVDAAHLAAFAETTAPAGFSSTAFLPAYGLAESTLLVTAASPDTPVTLARIDTATLRHGEPVQVHAVEKFSGPRPSGQGWVAGLGVPDATVPVRIVDGDGRTVPEGVLGEVAVRGGSVALGYGGETDDTPGSTRFVDGELFSGDAGFVLDGELFVLGRMGSALKIRGRALFMEDVETKVARGAGLSKSRLTAVAVTDPGAQGIALFVEREAGDWLAEARRILRGELGPAHTITIVTGPRGLIRRTSSGKPRRKHLWQLFASGGLGAGAVVHAQASGEEDRAVDAASGRRLLLSREFIEQLLGRAMEVVAIAPESTVLLEGSIAEGFGNAGSDIDFLVVSPGDDMTPTMPTILFLDGRRIEVRTRSVAQVAAQLDYAEAAGGRPDRVDKDLLNRVQRFHRAVVVRRGEVDIDRLRSRLPYPEFCASMRTWWAARAEQSLRQAVALAAVGAHPQSLGWAQDGLLQSAKAWSASRDEGYLETKWTVPQLDRIGDDRITARYRELYDAAADEDADPGLLDDILAFGTELGVPVVNDPKQVVLARIPKVTTWQIGDQVHVVRNDAEVFALSPTAGRVWRSVVFGRSLAELLGKVPDEGAAAVAEFVEVGLVGLKWRGAGPITPSYAMCDFAKPFTPAPCGLAPAVTLTGAARTPERSLSLSPLPARRFVEAAMNMIWSNVVLENAREDLVGALQNRQGPVADIAAHRLLVGAIRMLVSAFGITPLPADVAPRTTVTRLIPDQLDNRGRMLELVTAAQRIRFSRVLESGADGHEGLEVFDAMVGEIRTVLRAEFPASFDSGEQWRKTLSLGYDWLRLGGYLNADLPIDEARDLLTSGGVQPHLKNTGR
ncbi:AMP-binding protein [Nocardia mexicana]|uniref:Acyl-CoA synthetase (AMP-forming)/AMP-acid ligase II n=1 Tax=Nocardia mexicana TaxID=279262 RepID=A0A370GR58_9NOCA|nr:AMP-binding protein [Nocardia mexicana]RDI44944.1 acyl-CoA synthetase (AMP-forming)/AMP-acid ligase II [Nocardia mexicana]